MSPIAAAPNFSLEVFPPRSPNAERRLSETLAQLDPHSPSFVSVTFTGGDGAHDRAATTIARVKRQVSTPVAAHLTCAGDTKAETLSSVDTFASMGVRHIVALRGDAPTEAPDGFRSAAELVAAIRARSDARISVAAYPDPHPLSASPEADVDNLVAKFDAGADDAITQFFFETDSFLRLRDALAARGVDKPLIPGVLPIVDFAQVRRFALRCGAHIPQTLTKSFKRLKDDPKAAELYALTITLTMIGRLAREGVEDFHIYALNQWRLPKQIISLSQAGAALDAADEAIRSVQA